MPTRICLCTMCGIPASGKSFFCQRLDQNLSNDYIVVHVNYDKILLTSNTDSIQLHESLLLQHQDKTQTEGSVFKTSRHQVLQLVEIIIHNLKKFGLWLDFKRLDGLEKINKDIQERFLFDCQNSFSNNPEHINDVLFLIDDNLYFSSMRYEFYKLAKQYETGFCEIYMYSSKEDALERNKTRKGKEFVSEAVILNMTEKLEPPNPAKFHWEKYSMRVTTDQMTDVIHPMIKEAFENPVQPISQLNEEELALSRAVCSKNLIHQADLILRQCVANVIAQGKRDSQDVRSLSKQAMEVKYYILNALKSGFLKIPHEESVTTIHDASKGENCDLYKYFNTLFSEKLKATH